MMTIGVPLFEETSRCDDRWLFADFEDVDFQIWCPFPPKDNVPSDVRMRQGARVSAEQREHGAGDPALFHHRNQLTTEHVVTFFC